MAKLPRSTRKVARRSNSSSYSKSPAMFGLVDHVFDLLFLEGKDLCQQPLSARRKLLAQVLEKAPEIPGSLVNSEALKINCSVSLKSSVWRVWSPKEKLRSTKRPAHRRLGQV